MNKTLTIFLALVGVSLLQVSVFFCPSVRKFFQGPQFLVPIFTLSLLGVALVFTTKRQKVEGQLRKLLMLTGGSVIGFFTSVILHNLIYGLFIYLFGPNFWDNIGFGDEPFFFLIAVFVFPVGFVIGTSGSAILFFKHYREKTK